MRKYQSKQWSWKICSCEENCSNDREEHTCPNHRDAELTETEFTSRCGQRERERGGRGEGRRRGRGKEQQLKIHGDGRRVVGAGGGRGEEEDWGARGERERSACVTESARANSVEREGELNCSLARIPLQLLPWYSRLVAGCVRTPHPPEYPPAGSNTGNGKKHSKSQAYCEVPWLCCLPFTCQIRQPHPVQSQLSLVHIRPWKRTDPSCTGWDFGFAIDFCQLWYDCSASAPRRWNTRRVVHGTRQAIIMADQSQLNDVSNLYCHPVFCSPLLCLFLSIQSWISHRAVVHCEHTSTHTCVVSNGVSEKD